MATLGLNFVKIHTGIASNRKLRGLRPNAKWLYVALIAYCGEHLTDGFVADADLPWLLVQAGVGRPALVALVDRQLAQRCEGGWMLEGYLKWNQSAEAVAAKRQVDKLRKRDVRADSGASRDGVHGAVETLEVEVEEELLEDPSSDHLRARPSTAAMMMKVVNQALDVMAERDLDAALERGTHVTNAAGFVAACRASRTRDHLPALQKLAYDHPDATGAELVALVAHPATPRAPARPDPLARMAAAQSITFERNARRDRGEACPRCEDAGVYLDDDGLAHDCDHRLEVEPVPLAAVIDLDHGGRSVPSIGFGGVRQVAGMPKHVPSEIEDPGVEA